MEITHIFYKDDSLSNEIIETIHQVLGPSTLHFLPESFESVKENSHIVFLLSKKSGDFLYDVAQQIQRNPLTPFDGKVVLFSMDSASFDKNGMKLLQQLLPQTVHFSPQSNSYLSKEEFIKDLLRCKRYLYDSRTMPDNRFTQETEHIFSSHNTCTLCTGYGNRVRATPIEYYYRDQMFYFLSEGGEKFAGLFLNPMVSIAIYEEYTGFSHLEGVQITGTAQKVVLFSDEYANVIAMRGLTIENLKKMSVTLHMIKVIPNRIEVLKSAFKNDGFDARQISDSMT